MKLILKRITIATVIVGIIAGAGFATYMYVPAVKNIFTPGYSSTYTPEEVNEKIFSLQKKVIQKLSDEYDSSVASSDTKRIQGNMNISAHGNSGFFGGKGGMNIENIDIQSQKDLIDIAITGFSGSGSMSVMGQTQSGALSIDGMSFIGNGSGSYIMMENIKNNLPEELGSVFPEEVIMTLNKLGESKKYINLTENFFFAIMQDQLKDNSSQSKKMYSFAMDFLKNEAIFVVKNQEETKYHLTLSPSICKLAKMQERKNEEEVTANPGAMPALSLGKNPTTNGFAEDFPSYEDFKNNFTECSEEEYTKFISSQLTTSNIDIKNLYIELSKTKTHFVSEIIVQEDDVALNFSYDIVVHLASVESSRLKLTIDNEYITGSGILLESNDNIVSGYMDIDVLEIGFDSDITLSGSTDTINIGGGYTLDVPTENIDRDLEMLAGAKIVGEITGNITENDAHIILKNSLSGGENGMQGNITTDTKFSMQDATSSGSTKITGNFKLGENASPISGEGNISWNSQISPENITANYKVDFDIPNIASGGYSLNYDLALSTQVASTFETPENIISQKSLNTMMKIHKRKIDTENRKKVTEIVKRIENGEEVRLEELYEPGIGFSRSSLWSKQTSDLRTLQVVIETKLAEGSKLKDIIIENNSINTGGKVIYEGVLDFKNLRQNGDHFKNLGTLNYPIRYYQDEKHTLYQIGGYVAKGEYIKKDYKGNYRPGIVKGLDEKSLFDIEESVFQDSESVGEYKGYMNGNVFILTKNITKAQGLENCKLNSDNNPDRSIRCTWNGEEIYKN